jgi:DNA-binding MarR family transcriptional regulator
MATNEVQSEQCEAVVGDGLDRWSDLHADAWIGLLQTHRRLTRELDAELEKRHGLTLSSLELLGRLAAADDRRLRLTMLADQTGLTLSRISRIVDSLEERGLVERRPCPADGRAINAHLTDGGLALARAAQRTHFDGVNRRFFERLEVREIAALAAVFNRLAPGAASECDASDSLPTSDR